MNDDSSRQLERPPDQTGENSFFASATLVVVSCPVMAIGILSFVGSLAAGDVTAIVAVATGTVMICISVAVFNYGILPLAIESSRRSRLFFPLIVVGVSFLLTALTLDIMTFSPNKSIAIEITEIMAWILGIVLPLVALWRELKSNP